MSYWRIYDHFAHAIGNNNESKSYFFHPFSSFLKIVLEICVDISQQNNFIAIRVLAAGSSPAMSVPVLVKSNVVIWGEE